MANADDTQMTISVATRITDLEKGLARAQAAATNAFTGMTALSKKFSTDMARNSADASTRIGKALDLTKVTASTGQQLQILQGAAHRAFDSIAAGASPLRAVQLQIGDIAAAIAEGGGLEATVGSLATKFGAFLNPVTLAGGAVALLAAGLLYYRTQAGDAAVASADFSEWLKKIGADSDDAAKNLDKAATAAQHLTGVEAAHLEIGATASVDDAQAAAMKTKLPSGFSIAQTLATPRNTNAFNFDAAQQLKTIIDQSHDGSIGIDKMHDALDNLVQSKPALDGVALAIQGILDPMFQAQKIAEDLNDKFRTLRNGVVTGDRTSGTPGNDQIAAREGQQSLADLQLPAFDKAVQDRMKAIRDDFESRGIFVTGDALRSRATSEVTQESINQGGGDLLPGLKSFIDHIDRLLQEESSGNPFAKNPNSSAAGVGQFINSTFIDQFIKTYPVQAQEIIDQAKATNTDAKAAQAAADSMILGFRSDYGVTKALVENYAKENAEALQKAGLAVTETNLQLAYVLGAGGTKAVLKAAPGTPVSQVLSKGAIAANPTFLGGGATTTDVINFFNKRTNDTRIAAGDLTQSEREAQSYDDLIKKGDEYVSGLATQRSALKLMSEAELESAHYQELLNDAKAKGIALTPAQLSGLQAEAQKMAAADVKARDYTATQKELNERMQFFGDEGVDLFEGLIAGGDSFKDSLKNITSALEDAILKATLLGQGPFAGLFGAAAPSTGGLGGLFGGLAGLLGGATLGTGNLYDTGGYTGPGTKMQPAGVVHKGEYVFDAAATNRIGVGNLEAIRRGGVGFAAGGRVSMPAPNFGVPSRTGSPGDMHVHINVAGARGNQEIQAMVMSGVQQGLKSYDKALPNRVAQVFYQGRRRGAPIFT